MASALSVGQIAGLMGGSSLLSFGGNLATSAINSSRSWKYAQRAMEYQDYLNRNLMRDYYSINRKSLESAGYNPLLALGSGAQGAIYSGSGINSDSDNGSQAVQSAIDAMRLRNENKLAKTQAKVNESQADLNTQQTYKTLADEINARANSAVATATEQKILNDIYWDNETNREIIKRIHSETKFNNERARGFSSSSSKSYGGSFSPDFSFDKKKGKFGFGISGSGNYSHSESRSY